MKKRLRKKRLQKKLGRAPVPPPTKVFKDRKKEARREACRTKPADEAGTG